MPLTQREPVDILLSTISQQVKSSTADACVLLFSKNSCPPCRRLKKELQAYTPTFAVDLFHIMLPDNATEIPEIMKKYEIMAFPTTIVVDKNMNEMSKVIGADLDAIDNNIASFIDGKQRNL